MRLRSRSAEPAKVAAETEEEVLATKGELYLNPSQAADTSMIEAFLDVLASVLQTGHETALIIALLNLCMLCYIALNATPAHYPGYPHCPTKRDLAV